MAKNFGVVFFALVFLYLILSFSKFYFIFFRFLKSENTFFVLFFLKWGLCALRHGIQISMEAILACHPARSTEWLDCHPKWCELWRIRTGPILWQRPGQSQSKHWNYKTLPVDVEEKSDIMFFVFWVKLFSFVWQLAPRPRNSDSQTNPVSFGCLFFLNKLTAGHKAIWAKKWKFEIRQKSYITVQHNSWWSSAENLR